MRERIAAVAVLVTVVAPFVLGLMASAAGDKHVVFRFQDPAIVESSGLGVVDGRFVTTNDSGDTGRVFVVDPANGETVGVTRWPGEPEDVEALAPAGEHGVWAGDIGDNNRERDAVRVTRLPVGAGDRDVPGATYELVYPRGATDAESLLTDPRTGRLLVASKGFLGGSLFVAPEQLSADHPNRLRELGAILPIATDGAFFPDGRHLVLRDYGRAVIYSYPQLEQVAELDLPDQPQGEGIAVDADGRVYVSSEGVRSAVLEVPLPPSVRAVVAPEPSPSPSASQPGTGSREGKELPEEEPRERDLGQWLLGTLLFVGAVVVLLVAVRPSRRR